MGAQRFHPSRVRSLFGLLISLLPLAVLLLVLSPPTPAQAANVVVGDGVHPSSCNMTNLNAAMTANTVATITFSCGGPATITLTQNGGLAVVSGHYITIDGGDAITLTGIDNYRLFYVQANSALTLTHIVLTHGFESIGGAIRKEIFTALTLDHATLRDNQTVSEGGAVNDSGGTMQVTNSLFEHNSGSSGAAIYSQGRLTVTNTIFRHNIAGLKGGALYVIGSASISAGQVFSNVAGQQGGGLFVVSGTVSLLDQASLSGNIAQSGGGAYVQAGGNLMLTHATVAQNQATNNVAGGGGIYLEAGAQASFVDSDFLGNQSQSAGGAIDNHAQGLSMLRDTVISNTADFGAGLYNTAQDVRINDSTFRGNAADNGGGIYSLIGSLKLSGSTVVSNTAGYGAGVSNNNNGITVSTVTLENSTLSGNNAAFAGGGLDNNGIAILLNVTISNNGAPSGGGLDNGPSATVLLTNTILAYSTNGGNCRGAITAAKFSLSSDNLCGLSGNINTHNPNNLDPLLTALGNYGGPTLVHMLKHDSPVLDGVVGSDAPLVDQRGQPRPGVTSGIDPGAVERQPNDSDLVPWLFLPLVRR